MKQDNFKLHRLSESSDFECALRNKGLTEQWLTAHCNQNSNGRDRLGIIVTKRVISKSVARNRIKRAIREVFRLSRNRSGYVGNSYDIVVRLRKRILPEEVIELRRQLLSLFMKVPN